ncbi:hypothetical protein MKX01_001985 [Papaver californicum]|nr:hypothetical protein MKX01_001985 [Papaver californicum]
MIVAVHECHPNKCTPSFTLFVNCIDCQQKRKTTTQELIKVIQLEQSTWKDPVIEFIYCLYVNYDFDSAQQKLRECEDLPGFHLSVLILSASDDAKNLISSLCSWDPNKRPIDSC